MAVTHFSENCHTREFSVAERVSPLHCLSIYHMVCLGNKTSSSGNFIEAVTLYWLPSWIRLSIEIKLEFDFISRFLLTNKYNSAASRPSVTIRDLNTHIMTPTQEQTRLFPVHFHRTIWFAWWRNLLDPYERSATAKKMKTFNAGALKCFERRFRRHIVCKS